ncbi:hypothetical protein TNCV_405281 [Trichonephila clavipes]|nr:hypothetical protein TNCV_405281 [Trichonephila clavipes]
MRPLEDAGKNGRTVADFSVMMVAVDLWPQKYPDLIFQQDNANPTYHTSCYELSNSLSSTSLTSQIARFLSNRVCLGYDGKVTASTRECG